MSLRIAVFAFNHISPFHLAVPCVVFSDLHPGFDLKVCAAEISPLQTSAGFSLNVEHGLADIEEADIVIVPSWHDPEIRPPQSVLDALIAAQRHGAQLVGLCLGAYVLAEAGLLDGRNATTHWAFAQDFSRRFPLVHLDPHVLYVEDGPILTSAGTAAGIDCCLHIVRQRFGAESANTIARYLVVPTHRRGGQAQYIDNPIASSARDSRLSDVLEWTRKNLAEPHSVDSLSERALMSRRSFTRHFRQLMGTSVLQWLLSARLTQAQRLLERTDHSIETISGMTGFGSPTAFRNHFRKAFAVTPQQWRQTFR